MIELFFAFILQQGIELSRQGDHEQSERILSSLKSEEPSYVFYRLNNAFMLNQKEEGLKYADKILYSFYEYPIRYKDLAFIMKADMETWKKDADDLDDISRDMQKIQNRLKNAKGGPKTQEMQKEVLDRLGKIIKDLEDEKDKKNQQQQEESEAEKSKKIQEGKILPPDEAPPGNESGTGQINPKRVKEIAEVWGKLPEKERAKAIRELTSKLPARDKVIVENYLKELQKRSGKR